MSKPKLGYERIELSPTRILIRNKSFWKTISMELISTIIEDLASSGKKVISTIPFRSGTNGWDYLIILQP